MPASAFKNDSTYAASETASLRWQRFVQTVDAASPTTVATHTYAASELALAPADDAGGATVSWACVAACDNTAGSCTLPAYDCESGPVRPSNASASVWLSALTDGTPYHVSYYWENAYGPAAAELAGDTYYVAFTYDFTQMTVPKFIAVTAGNIAKTDAAAGQTDDVCVSWTADATANGGSAVTANYLLYDPAGTIGTLALAADTGSHVVATDSAGSATQLCVHNLEATLVDVPAMGGACEARMYFAIARGNEMGSSWENEDPVTWTQSAADALILCKPSGTFVYTATWDADAAEISLSVAGADDGGQTIVGHACTIGGTGCSALTGTTATFAISDLTGSCWTGANETVTLSCSPYNYVGTAAAATSAPGTIALEYFYPKNTDAYNHFMLSPTENWMSTIPPWVYLDWSAGTATGVTFKVRSADVAYDGGAFGTYKVQDCVYDGTTAVAPNNVAWDAWWADSDNSAACGGAALIVDAACPHFTCTQHVIAPSAYTAATITEIPFTPVTAGDMHVFVFSVCAEWGLCFDQFSEVWLATIPSAPPSAAPTGLLVTQDELLLTFSWTPSGGSYQGSVICMPSAGAGFGYEYDTDGASPQLLAVDCTDYQNVFRGNRGYIMPADADADAPTSYNDATLQPWVGSAFDAYNATDTSTRDWTDPAAESLTSFVVCEIYFSLLSCSAETTFAIEQPPSPAAPEPVTAELYNDIVILVDWADPRADPVGAPADPCEIVGYDVQFWDVTDSGDEKWL